MSSRPLVAVIGAVNVDLVATVERLPAPGETVTHGTFARHDGGKGGNQAVSAARALGDTGDVMMICSVGDDDLGAAALDALRSEGIEIAPTDPTTDDPTGVALILVDADAENMIAVAPGANERVDPRTVVDALDATHPDVVLGSLEVPPDAVIAGAEWCADNEVPFVLNPAPMDAEVVGRLLPLVSYITPNEHELEQLGGPSDGVVTIETRGSEGAIVHQADQADHVPSPKVDAVDTTGAGDCFNGVLAASLAEGMTLHDAVQHAVVAAAWSVTQAGAREGMPSRDQLRQPS